MQQVSVRLHPSEEKVSVAAGDLGELSDPLPNSHRSSSAKLPVAPPPASHSLPSGEQHWDREDGLEDNGSLAAASRRPHKEHKEKKRHRKVGVA